MTPVFLESPYAGDTELHDLYLDQCILDCLNRGESPYASHRMLVRSLDDANPTERARGINAGDSWRIQSDYIVVYEDFGVSSGMRYGIDVARLFGKEIYFRKIQNLVLVLTRASGFYAVGFIGNTRCTIGPFQSPDEARTELRKR